MNSKEVNEIKKTLKFTDCSIRRIVGCFVDAEKEMHMVDNVNFLSIQEEEQHKYFSLIKKGLSGKIGKKLLNVSFETDNGITVENRQKLMDILDYSKVDDYDKATEKIKELYTEIKDNCSYEGCYFMMTIYGVYDVPGMASDGLSMDDASDTVYNFILTLICPMKQSKPGLTYNHVNNTIENAVRNMLIEAPVQGFLFPAFNDRTADIHSLLYYTNKEAEIAAELLNGVLGCVTPATSTRQNQVFLNAMDTIDELTFEKAKNVYSNIREMDIESKELDEIPVVDVKTVERVLEESGLNEEEITCFSNSIKDNSEEHQELLLSNIFDGSNKLKIKTGKTEISVPVESTDLVDLVKIDGKNCIVIEVNDSVTLNGVEIKKFI